MLCCSNGKGDRFSCFCRIGHIFENSYVHQFWRVFKTFWRILCPCMRPIRIAINKCVWNIIHETPQEEVTLRLTKVLKKVIPIGKWQLSRKMTITFFPQSFFVNWEVENMRTHWDHVSWKLHVDRMRIAKVDFWPPHGEPGEASPCAFRMFLTNHWTNHSQTLELESPHVPAGCINFSVCSHFNCKSLFFPLPLPIWGASPWGGLPMRCLLRLKEPLSGLLPNLGVRLPPCARKLY